MRSSPTTIFAKLRAACVVLCLCASALPALAQAGDPDIRNLQPFVMVIVDTSGSMERLPSCVCTTPACTECLPNCALTNDTNLAAPPGKKNRWGFVLEALTGSFVNFQCTPLARTVANGMTYDAGYPIPYNQPWACPSSGSACANSTATVLPLQNTNGVLDTYASRLRFGLMTFDGMDTYFGANPLIPASAFNVTLSNAQNGMWSYAGGHTFHYPKCTEDYMMDTGARSTIATEGALVSVSTNACANPPCDIYQINAMIQDTLLRTRPYGGTPIAASLDDLYYHFKNDTTDTFGTCRDRYALLITDGYPDTDYREYGCDCKVQGNCPAGEDPNAMHCPYPRAEDAAHNLFAGMNGDPPQLKQLFVIGISIADSTVKDELNLIAAQGGSTELDAAGNTARFADDFNVLSATMDKLFGGLSKPVSRSVPAFAYPEESQVQSHFPTNRPVQYQISTGFQVALDQPVNGIAPPWTGIIERQRFSCPAARTVPDPQQDPISSVDGDRYQDVLNAMDPTTRKLRTVVPASAGSALTPQAAALVLTGAIDRGTTSVVCPTTGCTDVALSDGSVSPMILGLATTDTATQTLIRDWMYGMPGSVRANKRLADIYHSSPAILGPPGYASTDPDYTSFRIANAQRPLTMFVGTNDGILHAFSVEDYTNGSTHYSAGEEMWGFVPPTMLPKLKLQLANHQFGMDGSPELKDVLLPDSPTPSYHTVLVSGMRGGGNAYVALDVTDPTHPSFMWQFSDPDMGLTYGRPTIIQARFKFGTNTTPETRAVAILPGGVGTKSTVAGTGCTTGLQQPTLRTGSGTPYSTLSDTALGSSALTHRQATQCWAQTGRALYFIDVATGTLIKKIFDADAVVTNGTVFGSPVTGAPVAYPDGVGTVATNGYVVDADGLIWRIDLNATDPDPTHAMLGWTVRPFHDIFWDGTSTEGETTYERPMVSIDDQHRLVVIVGTGDGDNFDKPNALNRVASVTEVTKVASPASPDDYQAAMNWEIRVPPVGGAGTTARSFLTSELVTGSMALFQSQLFFASFVAVVNATNACSYGRGRLWSVSFNQRDTAYPNSTGTFGPLLVSDTASTQTDTVTASTDAKLFNVDIPAAEENLLVLGLGTTQRPSCQGSTATIQGYFGQDVPKVLGGGAPAIFLVAQASSDNRARTLNNAQLQRIEIRMNRAASFTRTTGWASSTD
ncbi:MAG TPA: PilC/PilY family type IV pilus protein [Polyangiales bacterium]